MCDKVLDGVNNIPIKIRLDIKEDDPLYKKFNVLKKKIGLNANTEVVRYAIKNTYDNTIKEV